MHSFRALHASAQPLDLRSLVSLRYCAGRTDDRDAADAREVGRLKTRQESLSDAVCSTITIGVELRSVYDTEISTYTSWVVFAPNFIVDARFGVFTRVQLDVGEGRHFIEDPVSCELKVVANTRIACS